MNEAEAGIFLLHFKHQVASSSTFAKRVGKDLFSYRSSTCCPLVRKESKRPKDLILVKGNLATRYEAKMFASVFQG